MSYYQEVKRETSAALLWIFENRGIDAFLDSVDLLYDRISPDELDEDSELIYGSIPYTAQELTDMYDSELRGIYV